MTAFARITSTATVLPLADIDTDVIFPARFLLITSKSGLGRYAFYDWRHDANGLERPDFALNRPGARRAEVLIAGANFGCGSSREQAAWALRDLGVRCIVSSSFGEIFHANCFKNGLLPIVVNLGRLTRMMAQAELGGVFDVDLTSRTLTPPDGESLLFDVEPWRREALLEGWDESAMILRGHSAAIADFEHRQRTSEPWLYGD